MSILIKGMEMPKTMSILAVFSNGYVAVYDSKDTFIGEAKAVPVPPHGRLIDADAFSKRVFVGDYLRKVLTASKEELRVALTNMPLMINNSPTIIPADKEGQT